MQQFKDYRFIFLVVILGLITLGVHSYSSSLAHVWFSFTALTILILAALQAIAAAIQARILKQLPLQKLPLLQHLPAVQTMQQILFKILWTGFIFLSLVFISAFIYLPNVWQHTQFTKLLPAIMAWGLFAALLYGYHKSGWSSDMVTSRTIAGVLLLLLAYFGSKLFW